jgi:hypothetical protein
LGLAVSEESVDELEDDRDPLERWGGVADGVGWVVHRWVPYRELRAVDT